jgi:hypothetical protein
MPPATTPETQLARFRQAIELLGGQRATARVLGCNERTIRALWNGERPLHDGWLRDIAAALIAHADQCRALERQISPAFTGNLTEDQRTAKRHGNRFDARPSSSEAVGQKENPHG